MNVIGVPDRDATQADIDAWVASFHPLYTPFYAAVSYTSMHVGAPKILLPPRFAREEAEGVKVSVSAVWSVQNLTAGLRLEIFGLWGRVSAHNLVAARRCTIDITLLDETTLPADLMAALHAVRLIPGEGEPWKKRRSSTSPA